LTVPPSVAIGRPLAIGHTLRNAGTAPTAGVVTIRFYLSSDDVLDASDVLLGSRVMNKSLEPGASGTAVTIVTLPASTPAPATYRVIAVADALDQQVELDETNNVAVTDGISVVP
jgi:subtilase family serine protease